jgi:hypothetical protein
MVIRKVLVMKRTTTRILEYISKKDWARNSAGKFQSQASTSELQHVMPWYMKIVV